MSEMFSLTAPTDAYEVASIRAAINDCNPYHSDFEIETLISVLVMATAPEDASSALAQRGVMRVPATQIRAAKSKSWGTLHTHYVEDLLREHRLLAETGSRVFVLVHSVSGDKNCYPLYSVSDDGVYELIAYLVTDWTEAAPHIELLTVYRRPVPRQPAPKPVSEPGTVPRVHHPTDSLASVGELLHWVREETPAAKEPSMSDQLVSRAEERERDARTELTAAGRFLLEMVTGTEVLHAGQVERIAKNVSRAAEQLRFARELRTEATRL